MSRKEVSKGTAQLVALAGFPEGFYAEEPEGIPVVRLHLYQGNNPQATPGREHCSFTVWGKGASTFTARAKIQIRKDQVPAGGDIWVTQPALLKYIGSDKSGASVITEPTKAMLDRQGNFTRKGKVDMSLLDGLFAPEAAQEGGIEGEAQAETAIEVAV